MEKRGVDLATVLAEAQRLGYAEADPSYDIDGFDARSKLVLLAALAFGEKITPSDIFMEGIRRITPVDFRYAPPVEAHRPADLRRAADAGRHHPFGAAGADSRFDHPGRRARPVQRRVGEGQVRRGHVLLRMGRGIAAHRGGRDERPDAGGARNPQRQPGARLARSRTSAWATTSRSPSPGRRSSYYLRFRVDDRPGIIAKLAGILAAKNISPGGGIAGAWRRSRTTCRLS